MQQVAVILIVLAAALYAAYRLPGAATRLRYAAFFKRIGLLTFGKWLEARELRAITAGGCAACSARDRHAPK
jgi:hypothetical protein